jgi:hypothetical protein
MEARALPNSAPQFFEHSPRIAGARGGDAGAQPGNLANYEFPCNAACTFLVGTIERTQSRTPATAHPVKEETTDNKQQA